MSEEGALDRLATQAGIEPDYYDIWGTRHALSAENKHHLLRAMGFAVATDAEVERSLTLLDTAPWLRPLRPAEVFTVANGAPTVAVQVRADRADDPLTWRVTMEDGTEMSGNARPCDLPLADMRRVAGNDVERRAFAVSPSLPLGYHRLEVNGDCLQGRSADESVLIVAPRQAYLPERLTQGAGTWGCAAQVYGLQGRDSWGMGDFNDLAGIAEATGALGAGVLGVNPLHALFPGNPWHASPYSPSSRRFLNILYIDVASVPDYVECSPLPATGNADLEALRHATLVDYPGVAALKLPAFEQLYKSFCRTHLLQRSVRAAAFDTFRRDAGISLERFAIFSALDEHFRGGKSGHCSWRDWPLAYREPGSPEVAAFAQAKNERVLFHQYLQWEADRQLGLAADACQRMGMSVGLFRDLAVGVDPGGADAWADQEVFAEGISTGAPPDPFNLKGQSWGLPPFKPLALRASAFRPFVEALRANMRHAGALRIDHVMGLMRLFWVPQSADAAHGGYVRYPLDDLIAITALESQRARCIVVGEDLGTVPAGLRERLAAANILSTRLLYFEHDGGEFRPAHSYPKLAQVSIGTQDLPTFSGFWKEKDIFLNAALKLLPSPEREAQLRQDRARLRQGLLAILRHEGLLPPDASVADIDIATLTVAAYRFLAGSPARLVLLRIEDLFGVDDQINLPGTIDEYPNWRAKLPDNWQELVVQPGLTAIAHVLTMKRPQEVET